MAAGDEYYPWPRWFDGNGHLLLAGVDFHHGARRFQTAATRAGRRWGKKVITQRYAGNGMLLVAIPEKEEERS